MTFPKRARKRAWLARSAVEQGYDVVTPEEMKPGRKSVVEYTFSLETNLPSATAASMDAFMQQHATEVCLQNVEKIEPKPGDPDVRLCYLEPNDMGPYRSQMRLTVKVVPDAGRCDIKILDMEPGSVDKKTGEVTFDPGNKMDFTTENVITWETNETGGVRVTNRSSSRSVMKLPWWFPLPDGLVTKLTQLFVGQVISAGLKKVNKQIEEQYLAWVVKTDAA